MRKVTTCLGLLVAAAAALAAPAMAVSLLSETFTYPDGNLVPNGGWANHSGVGTDIQVLSGVAVGDMNSAPDDNRTFAAQDTFSTTYACFNVRIPNPGGTPRTNYFAHLKDGTTTNFVARVFVAPQGTTFSFGLSVFSGTMAVQWATALNYDQWYTVVIRYNPATDTATLWVNPVTELSTNITTTAAAPAFSVSAFALRESNTGTGTLWKYNVDNVGVGTTFDDACASGPTPTRGTTWGRLKSIYR